MGPIYDRTREHLGSTDLAIARFRRLMIQAARSQTPLGLDGSTDYSRLATDERIVPLDTPWQEVAPCT